MPDNRVPVYYKGGDGIDRFRVEPGGVSGPEDWVGSLTPLPKSLLGADVPRDTGVSMTVDSARVLVAIDLPLREETVGDSLIDPGAGARHQRRKKTAPGSRRSSV